MLRGFAAYFEVLSMLELKKKRTERVTDQKFNTYGLGLVQSLSQYEQ